MIMLQAAIFSAIVTTFVTQTYQSLQPGPELVTQGLLAELVAIQRVAANGSSVNDIPSYETSAPSFTPVAADVWINSLWFISLILGLLTAFLGVLAKQWLYQYVAVTSGSPRARALVRQARSMGLNDWHVPALIGFLPIILHLSLALFLVGLVILLHPILPSIAYLGIASVGTVYTAYIISNILPVLYPRCPYRTSLTPRIYQAYHSILALMHLRVKAIRARVVSSGKGAKYVKWRLWQQLPRLRLNITIKAISPTTTISWKEAERNDALNTKGALEAKAISWLYMFSYNPTAKQIVLESFAGLNPDNDQYSGNWDVDLAQVADELERGCTRLSSAVVSFRKDDTDRQLELYLWALLLLQPFCPDVFQMGYLYQLPLPEGVEQYWDDNMCGPRLTVLLECGLYDKSNIPFEISYDGDFLHNVRTASKGIELTPGIWVALLRRQTRRERMLSFRDTVETLIILQQLKFFSSTRHIQANDSDIPLMTIDKPNRPVSLAMWHYIIRYTVDKVEPALVNHNIPRILLHLIVFAVENPHMLYQHVENPPEDDVYMSISVMLGCILQNQSSTEAIWSSEEMELLVKFTKTNLIQAEISSNLTPKSRVLRDIHEKTVPIIEKIYVPPNPSAVPLPDAISDAILRLALRTFLLSSQQSVGHPPGYALLCWAFDQHHEQAYEDVCNVDIISKLGSNTGALYLLEHLLDGIPTEQERLLMNPSALPGYADQLIEHIHQPNNLLRLCRHLLSRYSYYNLEASLVRLLALKPSDPAWVACLVALKGKYRESKYWVDREEKKGILAMQDILDIHARDLVLDSDSLEALAMDLGIELASDNEVRYLLRFLPFA